MEEHFTGDISAQLVITHPNSVVALSPCGRDVAVPYCREEVQIRDIAWERNLDYFHCETVCVRCGPDTNGECNFDCSGEFFNSFCT